MFQNNSSISVNGNQSEIMLPGSERCSLPDIYTNVPSKKEIKTPPNSKQIQKLKLPKIREDPDLSRFYRNSTQPEQEGEVPISKLKELPKHQKNTFARQMEERMRFVLGGLETNNQVAYAEEFDSQEFDFDARVNANRQLIKKRRQKNQKKNPSSLLDKRSSLAPKTAHKGSQRKDSAVNKKARDSDPSIQNKNYHIKRKQTGKSKETPSKLSRPLLSKKQSQKDLKSKEYQVYKTESGQKPSNKIKRVNSQKSVNKNNPSPLKFISNKNCSLFDGLQNYLSNPTNKKSEPQNKAVGLALLKAKRDIEDKIKQINKKLGIEEEKQEKEEMSPSTTHHSQQSDREKLISSEKKWQRIQISNKAVTYEETNFDNEIERLGLMQQKNGISLEGYLQHQKILLELELQKKIRLHSKKLQAKSS